MKYRRILILSLVVVGMFCVLGLFARPFPNDEYDFYDEVIENGGVLKAAVFQYLNVNGRFTNLLLILMPYIP